MSQSLMPAPLRAAMVDTEYSADDDEEEEEVEEEEDDEDLFRCLLSLPACAPPDFRFMTALPLVRCNSSPPPGNPWPAAPRHARH